MSRKPPIRTYQRKNIFNPLVKICGSLQNDLIRKHDDIPKEPHKINTLNEDKVTEDSLDYDPFETTFDRITKDAIVPPIPLECIDDKSWCDSSSDTSNEKKDKNKSLFDISVGMLNNSISSNKEESWKKMSYGINVKEKKKKTNVKILSKSKHTKKLTAIKKDHKKKRKVGKTTEKKENKYDTTEPPCATFNRRNDKLYDAHTVNADIYKKTDNDDISNTNSISNRNTYEDKIGLLNSSVFQPHNPLRETNNILNINEKKETCLLKPSNGIQELANTTDSNCSFASSESYKVSYLTNNPNIKSCFVKLSRDIIEEPKLMMNKSNNIVKCSNTVLDKTSNNTLNYQLSINDKYLKENLICSTPISKSKKTAYSLLYSPINADLSMKCIANDTNENVLHINKHATNTNNTNVLMDHVHLTNLPVLSQISINNPTNTESDTQDKALFEKDMKAQTSTLVNHLLSNSKVVAQEQKISHLETSKNSPNFINNREKYDTIFMDDSIGIAFKQTCGININKNNSPKILNTFGETNRSLSLFNDSESKLHISRNAGTMSDIKDQSLTNMNVHKSNDNNKLELESSTSGIQNDEVIELEIPKQEKSCELVITTKEECIEKCIENENKNTIKDSSCNELHTSQHQSDINETNVLFTKLQDSMQVTKRQKKSWKRNLYLSNIHEDENDFVQHPVSEISQCNEKVNANSSSQTKNVDNTSINTATLYDDQNSLFNKCKSLQEKFIFLKPGKSWTRSLSILHNFQNGSNLNEISVEKGKKWRHSVNAILEMQKKELSSSYKEQDECTDKLRLCNEAQTTFHDKLSRINNSNKFSLSKQITRRISIRVVRDSECIRTTDDTSFLEVYGISTNIKPESTILETSCTTTCDTQYADTENNYPKICSSKFAREVVLQKCSQNNYLPFTECVLNINLKYYRKIGEGVYGEVFLYEKDNEKSVLKIIPIEGDQLINGEPQKKFDEILSEIVIAKELHNLRFNEIHSTSGFVEVKSIKCIQGKYPEEMINLWKGYDNEKTSDNDCPSVFDENQLYIALELGHGGQDLESFEFHTAFEAHTSFIQTALALAVAEKSFKFEHRDLHWGNILISYTDEQYIHYKFDNKDIFVPSNGVKVCIIDFTLSRMSYQGCCIFNDLALDPALFTAQGEYQFEIYRLMRNKIKNNWQVYEPYTNILWLHYVVDKMITMVRYKKKNLKKHKNGIIKLQNLKQIILSYKSAFDFVNNCDQIISIVQSCSA